MTAPLVAVLGGGDIGPALIEASAAAGVQARLIHAVEGARGVAAVTWLSHSVPLAVLREIQKSVAIVPSMAALEASRDRLLEKQLFKSLGILTAPFAGVESTKGIKAATSKFGLPALLKPRLKGMPSVPISEASDCEHAWEIAGPHAVVEARVEVVRAFTLAAARSADGSTQFWPLNDSPLEIQKAARGAVLRLLDALKFVGVMSLEFFEVHGGLLAHSFSAGPLGLNEPRALENHLRAVAGLPLAACE